MKVLLIVPGGLASEGEGPFIPVLALLTEYLARFGNVTAFALAQDSTPREYGVSGARVVSLGAPLDIASNRGPLLAKARQVRRAYSKHGPFDLVHAFWANTSGFLASLTIPSDVPLVVSLAGGELASCPEIEYGQETTISGRIRVEVALRRADAITAASGFIEEQARRRGYAVHRVPLGVGPESFLRPAPIRSRPPFSIVSVASLNRVKGPFVLLDAFRIVLASGIDARLTLIGEDTLEGTVQERARELGLSGSVSFSGHLSPREVRASLAASDLLVVSSYHEAGPVAALEAAAAGVPVVGTAVGHLWDWRTKECVSVPVGDPRRLGLAISELLASPLRREELRRNALEWAKRNDAASTASRFWRLYESLTKTS